EHLAAQRQDRLARAIAPLLGRYAGGVSFDDEDLAVVAARRGAVAQLPRQRQPGRGRRLARHFLLRRAAGLARARGEDDARHDRLGDRDVGVEPVLERRPHLRVDRRRRLRVVQAILGLPLELRLGEKHAEHRDQPFADVFRSDRHALGREVVRLDEVAHRLAQAGAETVLVRAARTGRDAVDVAPDVLVGGLRPLQREIEADAAFVVLAHQRERRLVHRRRAALADDLLQVVGQPLGVLEDGLLALRLVLEGDTHALVQVAGDLEPLLDDLAVELDFRKDGRVRVEVDGGPRAARRTELLQRPDRMPLLETLLPRRAVALDRRDQLLRQRVDHARADAVQAAGGLVVARLEL